MLTLIIWTPFNTAGGAWIIGYKLWCALIGRGLSSLGVLTIVPDYRNFPQGDVEDMVTDVIAAVSWTSKNAHLYGGDPQKIILAGQSAGIFYSRLRNETTNHKFLFLNIILL